MRRLALVAFAALCLEACTSDCLKLAQKICDCQPTSNLRDTCNTDAANQKALLNLNSDQEKHCAELLKTCDCRQLGTPEGKVRCGQARAPDSPP